MRWQRARPRPVPRALVEKKGEKSCAWCSSGMPGPVSSISTERKRPRPERRRMWKRASSRVESSSSPVPPSASRAFFTRFKKTCVSCARSPRTGGRLGSKALRSATPPQPVEALHLADDDVGAAHQLGVAERAAQQLRGALDAAERVLDLVRQAAGDRAERGEAVGAPGGGL